MKMTRRALLASASLICAIPALASPAPLYKRSGQPIPERVRDLLQRMTLDEKVAQLCCLWMNKRMLVDVGTFAFSPERAAKAIPHGIGQIGRPSDLAGSARYLTNSFREPEDMVNFINAVQKYAVENTRLGIPVLFHEETAHGLAVKGATSFPIPPALGSTWDPELVEACFTLTARQARLRGVTVALSPVLDLVRDPRWGRSEELFGEDPHHVGVMGAAAVKGLQGPARPIAPDRLFATLKHFVHGMPQNGLNIGPSDMSERLLREAYLPPFMAAVKQANAAIIMPSYNEVGGVPSHANADLLQKTGRGLLGFKGAYFSDYGGVAELASLHGMAEDPDGATILALNAGVDADLPEGSNYLRLAKLVKDGRVPLANVDAAVARVLAMKFEAGLFENPYVDPERAAAVLDDPAAIPLARKAAQKAIILLKNDGVLPLDASKTLRIALVGPNSVTPLLGGYSGWPKQTVGVMEGMRAAAGPNVTIEQSDGVWINVPVPHGVRPEVQTIRKIPQAENEARIAAAVEVARRSDVVVLVVGDNEQITRETVTMVNPGDRSSLGLYGDQDALVDAMLACGKPVIAVLLNGRPLATTKLAQSAHALIEGWYLGEQGGHAVADVLFGKVNPGGKLAVSIPRSMGELPAFYNRHPSADHVPYVEGKRRALYPFGYGLSYTTFELSVPRLSKTRIGADERFAVEVDVSNTGKREGDEVVQVYIRDIVSSVPRPVLELKAFRRVTLAPSGTATVRFELGPEALGFWDKAMKWSVEPGAFMISTGNSSDNLKSAKLLVV
ncbi:beta-glucosidase [Duganella sp. SG902]|uniref:glycoside hydrolase family 3 N-terminal domain-containing protein n=1 Tax=Duganella sp. SG902 TaxID=2587016 RepID=UPI00159D5CFF|nr:glycoside hydrolase family 3 N-terminal domain-containing protein [Duganella sp. SG902]NVM77534.1 beta-glucosidase [Duganella sp. SG902]